jgi:hypothetical protein
LANQPFQDQGDVDKATKKLAIDSLTMLKRYIKVASMLSIDNPAIKTLKKGQHMGQQSGQGLN